MKKIDKLVLGKFIGPFIVTFFITLFIIVMQFLWKYIDDLVGKGLEWHIVAELIFFASASFVPLALPLAVLLSSIMTLGDFGENYELVAAKSSGVSLLRFMAALIVAVLFISAGAFVFSNNILPQANLKFATLLYDVRHQKPALNIKEGVFYNEIEGYSIRVGKKSPDNKTIEDIIVYDHSSGKGNDNVLIAEKGEMFTTEDGRYLVLRLYDGKQYSEMKTQGVETGIENLRTYFTKWEKFFDLTQFALQRTDEKFWKKHYEMLNVSQLQRSIDTINTEIARRKKVFAQNLSQYYSFRRINADSVFHANNLLTDSCYLLQPDTLPAARKAEMLKKALATARSVKSIAGVSDRDVHYRAKSRVKHALAWHRKFTLAVACIVLFFIGAPMGAIIRIGGLGMPLVVAVLFFVVFHVLTMTGQKVAEESAITAFEGSWLATAVLLPMGIFLTYKAMRDSVIFNAGRYVHFVQSLTRWIQSIGN